MEGIHTHIEIHGRNLFSGYTVCIQYIIQSLHAGTLPLTHPRAPPLNAKKIAVNKVSDINVVIFGPEL